MAVCPHWPNWNSPPLVGRDFVKKKKGIMKGIDDFGFLWLKRIYSVFCLTGSICAFVKKEKSCLQKEKANIWLEREIFVWREEPNSFHPIRDIRSACYSPKIYNKGNLESIEITPKSPLHCFIFSLHMKCKIHEKWTLKRKYFRAFRLIWNVLPIFFRGEMECSYHINKGEKISCEVF